MDIGALEADVLKALKRQGKASAREVLEELRKGKEVAYTTISTTLDRLYRKGLLGREKAVGRGGSKYVYTYPENTTIQKEIVGSVVDKLVSAFGSSVVSTIYDRLDQISPEETQRLKELVEKGRRSSR